MYEKGRVYMDSEDLDLITYCIYAHLAMKEASITDPSKCYFIGKFAAFCGQVQGIQSHKIAQMTRP